MKLHGNARTCHQVDHGLWVAHRGGVGIHEATTQFSELAPALGRRARRSSYAGVGSQRLGLRPFATADRFTMSIR